MINSNELKKDLEDLIDSVGNCLVIGYKNPELIKSANSIIDEYSNKFNPGKIIKSLNKYSKNLNAKDSWKSNFKEDLVKDTIIEYITNFIYLSNECSKYSENDEKRISLCTKITNNIISESVDLKSQMNREIKDEEISELVAKYDNWKKAVENMDLSQAIAVTLYIYDIIIKSAYARIYNEPLEDVYNSYSIDIWIEDKGKESYRIK